jgi:hypothetical protein
MLKLHVDDSKLKRRTAEMARLVPKATSDALNWTIYNVRDAQRSAMASVFDRPTPFTLNRSNIVKTANPTKLVARTVIRDDQSSGVAPVRYLGPQVFGGERSIKRFERALQARGLMPQGWYAMPGKGAKLDAYGNISRGQIMQILSVLAAAEQTSGYSANMTGRSAKQNKKPRDYFASTAQNNKGLRGVAGRLPYGIYQRLPGGKIVTILRFRAKVRYQSKLDYWGIARKVSDQDFPRLMRKAWQRVSSVK